MSIATLNKRLDYMGGNAERRLQIDKLRTLKKALLYSYQAATAILSDGREFRCLINDDKMSEDYDDKVISIPYYDICLNQPRIGTTTQGEEEIGMRPGDVFEWKETETHWLVYLEYLEEDIYFRAKICRCDSEIEINNHRYWWYLRGPTETTLQWNQKAGIVWNDINYSLIGYITQNEETLDFFHRFTKIKVDGKFWEVKAVNPYYGDGIIKVCLGEWYDNEMEEARIVPDLPEPPLDGEIYFEGQSHVQPYDIIVYEIRNLDDTTGGYWKADNDHMVRFLGGDERRARVEIITGKSGSFTLSYWIEEEEIHSETIVIDPL